MMKFLNACAEIEETVEAIYRHLAATLPEGHELRRLWLEMADDEGEHARQIRLAARLPAREVFTGVNTPLAKIGELLQRARGVYKHVQAVPLTLHEALKLSLQMETEFNSVHVALAVEFRDEAMQRMFQSLAGGDDRHADLLRRYATKVAASAEAKGAER